MIRDVHERLKRLASILGWRILREHRHAVDRSVPNLRKGRIITFWCIGDYDNLALHINENPPWYACVFAMRYRICTGWHWLYPYKDERRIQEEAERLHEFFWRGWFTSLKRRREFRIQHPECDGYTWGRLRQYGPPYYYDLRP